MKRILAIWCLCIPWYAFAVTNTVSSLPNTNTLADTNLFMVVVGSGVNKTNMNTSWAQLKALLPRISSSAGKGTNITLAGSTWIGASQTFGFEDNGTFVNFLWWNGGTSNRLMSIDDEGVGFEARPVILNTGGTIEPTSLLEASAITNAVKNSVTVAAGTGTTVNTNTVGNATVYTVNSTATGGGTSTSNNIPGAVSYTGTNFICSGTNATVFRCLVTQNSGLVMTNGVDGQTVTVELLQNGTGTWTVTTNGGPANLIVYGDEVTGPYVNTNAGKLTRWRLTYLAASNRWDVVGHSGGHPR